MVSWVSVNGCLRITRIANTQRFTRSLLFRITCYSRCDVRFISIPNMFHQSWSFKNGTHTSQQTNMLIFRTQHHSMASTPTVFRTKACNTLRVTQASSEMLVKTRPRKIISFATSACSQRCTPLQCVTRTDHTNAPFAGDPN